jgi:hypothetical protein
LTVQYYQKHKPSLASFKGKHPSLNVEERDLTTALAPLTSMTYTMP